MVGKEKFHFYFYQRDEDIVDIDFPGGVSIYSIITNCYLANRKKK